MKPTKPTKSKAIKPESSSKPRNKQKSNISVEKINFFEKSIWPIFRDENF